MYRRNQTKPGQSKFKSSLDIEMERIQQAKLEAEKMKQLSRRSLKQATDSVSYHPTRSKVEPTRPMEFKFETDSRIKDHSMETRQDKELKNFAGELRKHNPSPVSVSLLLFFLTWVFIPIFDCRDGFLLLIYSELHMSTVR